MRMASKFNFKTPDSNFTDSNLSDSNLSDPKVSELEVSDSNVSDSNASQWKAFRVIGGLIQLLAIGLCIELLLGITDGLGLILRMSFLAIVIGGVAFRLGWLTLIALQTSLFFQEPIRQPLEQISSGIFFVILSMLVILAAMNMPQTHRFVSDVFLRLFRSPIDKVSSTISSQQSVLGSLTGGSKSSLPFAMVSLAIHVLHMTFVVILAVFLLTNLPIGRQSDSWLQWSLQNGQAVWPGALLLVLMVALLVLARENSWRQLEPAQARLYLRSVQLIANYRDLFGFARQRMKQLDKKQAASQQPTLGMSRRPKIRKNSQTDRIDMKGLK